MNSDKSRLSWSADYPLPFESLWSILHKIAIFNHINIATICTMIQKDDSRINSWANSTWIDFERMGRLLRINPERLIAGTWENMEMTPAFKNGYSFRRCPECWRRGFHCVIFDIAWIINCPWHGCRLTEPCHQCGTKRTFQLSKKKDEYYFLQRVCSNCGLKHPNYRELLRQPQFTIEEKNWISESCIKFIDWWKRLGRIFPSRGSLLNDLIWTENIKSHKNPDSLILKIDFSTQASKPFPNEWEFYKNADKAKFIILNNLLFSVDLNSRIILLFVKSIRNPSNSNDFLFLIRIVCPSINNGIYSSFIFIRILYKYSISYVDECIPIIPKRNVIILIYSILAYIQGNVSDTSFET